MNSNQYKQVAQTTMNQALESGADELTAVRAACDNLGVALPNGTSGEVAETLATNDYMGWRACTAEEAQAAANEGVAALYTDGEAVSLVLPDAEVTALGSGAYYTYNAASTTTVIPPEEEYVEPVQETEDWHYYADRVVETAESVIGMTKAQVQDALDKTFVNSSWNAEFVLACFEAAEARKDDVIPVLDNAMAILNWYQSNQPSRVHAGKTGIQAGDLVFITDSFNMVYQMGIAASAATTGSVITIIGNRGVNSQVVEELLPTTGSFIGWYVHPDYAAAKPVNTGHLLDPTQVVFQCDETVRYPDDVDLDADTDSSKHLSNPAFYDANFIKVYCGKTNGTQPINKGGCAACTVASYVLYKYGLPVNAEIRFDAVALSVIKTMNNSNDFYPPASFSGSVNGKNITVGIQGKSFADVRDIIFAGEACMICLKEGGNQHYVLVDGYDETANTSFEACLVCDPGRYGNVQKTYGKQTTLAEVMRNFGYTVAESSILSVRRLY